jgi:hypothetical protein
MIDQRTPLAWPVSENLPDSAKKPKRNINPAKMRSPAYGTTQTSRLKERTARNTARNTVAPRVSITDMLERARSVMPPVEFEMFIRRLNTAVPR